ncbi:MAG: HAD family phosphatase [Pyrinomonadaceae bacterium]
MIINDEPIQMAAYQEVLGGRGVELTERDYYSCLGMDDRTFVRVNLNRAGLAGEDEELAREIIDAKSVVHRRMIADELPLFPGVTAFIKEAARHFTVGVVSMARRLEIDYVLERAGFAEFFPTVISAEDARACKPDPDCYLRGRNAVNAWRHARGEWLLSPDEFLVIEDSPPGIRAGRGAGMRTLGITNTVTEAELREAGADVVSASLADWNADAVRHVFDASR